MPCLEGLRFDLGKSLPNLVNIRDLALHRGPGRLEHGRLVLVLLLHKLQSQSTQETSDHQHRHHYTSNTVNDNLLTAVKNENALPDQGHKSDKWGLECGVLRKSHCPYGN